MTDNAVIKRSSEESKICIRCGEAKPLAAFHRQGRGDRRRGHCRPCRKEERRSRGERRRGPETPEERRVRLLWETYRLTPQQYAALLDAQDGVCAICRKTPDVGKRLVVDHCHATDVVRALLCTPCNVIVGVYENHRRSAAEYLATYGAGNPLLKQ